MKNVPKSGARREAKRQQHKRYYARTAFLYPSRSWTKDEDRQVLAHEVSDRELSQRLCRSMKAISNRRWRLRKENRNEQEPEDFAAVSEDGQNECP